MLKVRTLAASGEGSLAWAVSQPGPRIVVFEVSGVIEGDIEIPHGDLTIAGQTAPGAGITINGHLSTPYGRDVSNLIIRYLRVRPNGASSEWPAEQHDSIQISRGSRIIFDHLDASHGIDEVIDFWGGPSQITVQWSVISFPNPEGGHPEGAHNYCMINADGDSGGDLGGAISVHHNLFSHCKVRTPALSVGPAEVRNNLIYNTREAFVHHNAAYGDFNIVGNYYQDGPSASLLPFWFDPENANPSTSYYVANNYVEDPNGFSGLVEDPLSESGFDYSFYDEGALSQAHFTRTEHDFSGAAAGWVPVGTSDPVAARSDVLDCAGAWPRDHVTLAAVGEARDGTGQWRNLPLGDLMQGLSAGVAPADADDDGMADAWELDNSLDPSDARDGNTMLPSGYTAVEEYINSLATCSQSGGGSAGAGGSSGGGSSGGGASGGGAGNSSGDGGTNSGASGGSGALGSGGSGALGSGGAAGSNAASSTVTGSSCAFTTQAGPGSAGAHWLLVPLVGLGLTRRVRRVRVSG